MQDPKNYMPKSDDQDTMASLLVQIAQMQQETARLISEMKASPSRPDTGVVEQLLKQQERLLVKTRPENLDPPQISVYSHPEGERDRPKDPLKCKMRWVGYELTTDTLKPLEIELLNQLQPGEFRVTKADGTPIKFTVKAKYSDVYDKQTDRPRVEGMDIHFPCTGEHRQNHMSMVAYLQQALHGAIPSTDEMLQEVARLRTELERAKVGVIGAVA